MDSFEPFVNVLTVLTVLSVAAERLTNVVKLRREPQWKDAPDRQRELNITWTSLLAGVLLAGLMKADLFAMLSHADSPWTTLGWTRWDGARWVRHEATSSAAGVVQALLGSVVTGVSLGFGSKFWHDVLGLVVEMRKVTQSRAIPVQAEVKAEVAAVVRPVQGDKGAEDAGH